MRHLSVRLVLVLFGVALLGLVGMSSVPTQAADIGASFRFDMSDQGKVIGNKFSMVNSWMYRPEWTTTARSYPDDYFSSRFPFVERVHVMTATGGHLQRDLSDPRGETVIERYNFDRFIEAFRQIVRHGLRPYIKTGNVPLKMSEDPELGTFGVNVKPPVDYDLYYEYIKSLATALVDEFGIDEVKTWWWGVLTEYENKDWFDAGDPESTKIAYLKLYDYTVAALEDVLGPENVIVGAHSMSVIPGYWDEREFIEHVARGTNYKTGHQGTQLDFLAVSFYDSTLIGLDENKLLRAVEEVRQKAESVGLTDLWYGIDEGRVLEGWDRKPLLSRTVNLSAQGAADAKLFKVMVEHDIDWFATWTLATDGTWGGANAITSNVSNLVYKMAGDRLLGGGVVSRSSNRFNELDALASFDEASSTLRILVYNNSPSPISGTADSFAVTIDNVDLPDGHKVTALKWPIDDQHANWWPAWSKDQQARNISDDAYCDWSKYSVQIPGALCDPQEVAFWRSRVQEYIELGELRSTVIEVEVRAGSLMLADDIARHGVILYEIRMED